MRKYNNKNYNEKYEVKIYRDIENENEITKELVCKFKCCSYNDIVEKVPILKNVEDVRNYFRKYKENGCKYKISKNKFDNIEINKIMKEKTTNKVYNNEEDSE